MNDREKLLEILNDIKPDVEFEGITDLSSGQVLKSFDIMVLIGEIAEEFDVDIPVEEVLPENFESVDSILELIGKCRG